MRLSVWALIISIIILIATVYKIQFSDKFIIGADGYLHGEMSQMVARQGFLKSLPQAHFSWFATRFSDKDFLYHLYLVPFMKLAGKMLGTKIGAFAATSLLFTIIAYLLFVNTSSLLTVLSLGLLLSSQFLRDTQEARPLVFALLLTVLGIQVLVKQKYLWVFVVSLLYGLLHLSSWVLLFIAVIFSVSEWTRTGKGERKAFLVSLAGFVISFLLHPNFPNNLFYAYLNGLLVPYYAVKTGVLELGAEFFPVLTTSLIKDYPLLVYGFLLLFGISIIHPIAFKRETLKWGIATLIFSLFALFAKRNLTHLYPVFVIWFGLALGDVWKELAKSGKELKIRAISVVLLVSAFVLAASIWTTYTTLNTKLLGERIYSEHFFNVARFLQQKVPKGERIFHTNWSDSQYLIGLAPEYEYLVTLDPIYMYAYDQNLYELYRQVSFGQHPDPYTTLKDTFGTRHGYAGKNYFGNFINQIRNDKRFAIEGEDALGVVFSLKE